MKGSETRLVPFMEGSDKKFIIPVYQRNYDWKIERCKQLFDDLLKTIRRGSRSHFFGSIVSVYSEFNVRLVIDGQQRLTTISLLLLAMCNLMKKSLATSEKPQLADEIYETCLINKWEKDDSKRFKLEPIKHDFEAYRRLFGEESEYVPDSNITINYRYFLPVFRRGK